VLYSDAKKAKLFTFSEMKNMSQAYDPQKIEAKWQRYWEEHNSHRVVEDPAKSKYYLLEMFPYPSGKIHMGHVRNYCIGDVIARYKRMRGYNVLHPMGWDAFGLPAENAAREHGLHPANWTKQNIDYMRRQLKRMGYSYDWQREISTCEPRYYRWEQLIFIKLYERGLVYKKKSPVNWCPSCKTVLANEQVEAGGCWRCESPVIQQNLEQWFFKITDYAEELLRDCDRLTGWPERVITMQKNWIGKSTGVEIDFPLVDSDKPIKVFTTRPDTVYGATFVILAPEHPLVPELIKASPDRARIEAFVERMAQEDKLVRTAADREKEGYFSGRYALNPMTEEKIPIWIANFVLLEYGTGAIMSVPSHDQRDFEFARKYGLLIRLVIQPQDEPLTAATMTQAHEGEGVLVNSGRFNSLDNLTAKEKIADYMEQQGIGRRKVNYRLRDWGISRQRFWGAPIPIIYCRNCGCLPEAEQNLPVVLPMDIKFPEDGRSPLPELDEFVNTTCHKCGGPATRETDTLDTFVESSWYFERYASPDYDQGPFDPEAVKYWLPVDQYVGGIEHAVLHLLYSRFYTKVLRDLGLVKIDEPFVNLLTQGMVIKDGAKMSKSKGNVVDPEELINKYGADTARLFSLFASPPERDLEWSDEGVEGSYRFINRVWRLVQKYAPKLKVVAEGNIPAVLDPPDRDLRRKLHQSIKKVTEDIGDRLHFNTAISTVMELVNTLYLYKPQSPVSLVVLKEALRGLLLLLAPFTPHVAEDLWQQLGYEPSICAQPLPEYDPELIKEEQVLVVIQVNGKLRGRIEVPASLSNEEIKQRALGEERIQPYIAGKEIKKVIEVPKKLINIVV
jgi:leucyl-tRNA synthetase